MVNKTRRALDVLGRERFLLLYKTGEFVAIGCGDVENAQHIVITVPGFRGSPQRRLVSLVKDTDNILSAVEISTKKKGTRVAGIAWIGYRPPNFRELYSVVPAQVGSASLKSFLGWLKSVNPLSEIIVIGHSYGGVLTAFAVKHNSLIDKAILVGAPGAPLFADDRTAKVFVLTTPSDRVSHISWFSGKTAERGTIHFLSTPNNPFNKGHRAYFKENTPAVDLIAGIITHYSDSYKKSLVENKKHHIINLMLKFAPKIDNSIPAI